jgi:hypothetical protein
MATPFSFKNKKVGDNPARQNAKVVKRDSKKDLRRKIDLDQYYMEEADPKES